MKVGTHTLPDFKTYYKPSLITVVCINVNTGIQNNKTEDQEIDILIHGQLIFNKSAKVIQWKKTFLEHMLLEQVDIIFEKKCK